MHWSVSCMTRGGGGGRVHRWVEPVPAAFGQHTLVRSSAPHRADTQGQTTIHTPTPTKADLKWPVCTSPECLSLDCGRNPGDLERTPTDTARACKLQPRSLLLWRSSPNHCITVLRICCNVNVTLRYNVAVIGLSQKLQALQSDNIQQTVNTFSRWGKSVFPFLFPRWKVMCWPVEMCWPVNLQLRSPQCATWTGSFPLQLDARGNAPRLAAGNQRMLDRWAWRQMADCDLLKCSPSQAAAKKKKRKKKEEKKTMRAACAVGLRRAHHSETAVSS